MRTCIFSVLSVCLLLPVLSGGCKPSGAVKSPDDYLPYIAMGLEAGATAALLGKSEAKAKRAFSACVTTGVLSSAFNTASDAVIGISKKNPQIPAVDVDVSDCMEFGPYQPNGKEIEEDVSDNIEIWASATLMSAKFYVLKLKGNCKAYVSGMAAISYIETVVGPIVDEIKSPDGKITIPSTHVDFSACG